MLPPSHKFSPSRSQAFGYDELDRLTLAQGGYLYPANHIQPHAVMQAGSVSYGYDANGNMVVRGDTTIAYNYDNMPVSINTAAGDATTMVYDYAGSRVKKTGAGGSTVYIGKLYECSNGVCSKYIFAGSQRLAVQSSTAVNYYLPDHLGSSSLVTDAGGAKVEDIAYAPFGATVSDSGTANVRHKYTGQELDAESGLYNYGARLYDPAIGRFISADTIVPDYQNPQSLNRYGYTRNNPISRIDPSGHCDDEMMGLLTASSPTYDASYYDSSSIGGFTNGGGYYGGGGGGIHGSYIPGQGYSLQGGDGSWTAITIGKGDHPKTFTYNGEIWSYNGNTYDLTDYVTRPSEAPPVAASPAQTGGGQASSARLSYEEMTQLIAANNNSGQSDALIMAIAYKESGFNPSLQNQKSSAGGLMGLTDSAITDLRSRYEGFDNLNKYDPAQNIDAASQYLNLRIQWTHGNVARALAGYGTGSSYASSVMNAANALNASQSNPMETLKIHIGPR